MRLDSVAAIRSPDITTWTSPIPLSSVLLHHDRQIPSLAASCGWSLVVSLRPKPLLVIPSRIGRHFPLRNVRNLALFQFSLIKQMKEREDDHYYYNIECNLF